MRTKPRILLLATLFACCIAAVVLLVRSGDDAATVANIDPETPQQLVASATAPQRAAQEQTLLRLGQIRRHKLSSAPEASPGVKFQPPDLQPGETAAQLKFRLGMVELLKDFAKNAGLEESDKQILWSILRDVQHSYMVGEKSCLSSKLDIENFDASECMEQVLTVLVSEAEQSLKEKLGEQKTAALGEAFLRWAIMAGRIDVFESATGDRG